MQRVDFNGLMITWCMRILHISIHIIPWHRSACKVTIRGANQVAPGPAQAKWATDCVLGLVSLPSTERYSTIRFVYDSAAWGYDYMAFTVGAYLNPLDDDIITAYARGSR